MQITTIGLDIAKSVFQVHGVDAGGQVIVEYLILVCATHYRVAANGFSFEAAQPEEYRRFDRWLFGLLLGSTADERWQIGLQLLR